MLKEIEKRLIENKSNGEIKRIYPEEPESIVKEKVEQKMEVSMPLFAIGIKDTNIEESEMVKKHIAVEILLNMIIGKSSTLYKQLYNDGVIYNVPSLDYEFSKGYAHILISGQSKDPELLFEKIKQEIRSLKQNGINTEDFQRTKKMIYGNYVREYNDVGDIARMFLSDYFKGINSFEYLEEIENVNESYIENILKSLFQDEKMIISVVRS
jgi:predicted Zn-dependent peptidase